MQGFETFEARNALRFMLMKIDLLFHRVVALVFHRDQLNAKIAEQYLKTGIVWTFVKGDYQLEVDHIDFNPENHCANNLQFLTPQENMKDHTAVLALFGKLARKMPKQNTHRLQLQPRRWDIIMHRQCTQFLKTIHIKSGVVNTL